jgi:hypothetical protein
VSPGDGRRVRTGVRVISKYGLHGNLYVSVNGFGFIATFASCGESQATSERGDETVAV